MNFLRMLHDGLFPPRPTERLLRTVTLHTLSVLPTYVEHTEIVGLVPYREPVIQALVVEAKFHRSERAQGLLAQILSDYLTESLADNEAFEARSVVVVPVPLSKARRASRGYNQAEDIARSAAERIPQRVSFLPEILARVRDTVPQTTLGRDARLKNMRDAFIASEPLDPSLLYIVVDDVATTGATLASATAALTAAGALHIQAIALAH